MMEELQYICKAEGMDTEMKKNRNGRLPFLFLYFGESE